MFKKLLVLFLVVSPMLVASVSVWEGKKYTNTKSDKFEEYMKKLDVGWFLRTIGLTVHPTIELKRNGNNYTLVTQSTFRNTEINFQLGKEFDEETLDGRQVKSVITLENDNKLIQKQGGEKPSEIIREFDANKMVATMTVDDVVCTRTYEVQA